MIKKNRLNSAAKVVFASSVFYAYAEETGALPARPNILFILADDVGWSDFSEPYDPDHPSSMCAYFETPEMNRLAKEGLRFTDAYSPAPMCTPTRRSIQYGMTPARQRGTEFVGQFTGEGHLSIAEYIKQVDPSYRCATFGKWGEVMCGTWNSQNQRINPKALGYDESDGPGTGNHTGTFYNRSLGEEKYNLNYTCTPDPDPKRTFSVTERAIDFIRHQAEAGNPFYLQVNYYAIHTAHQALQETMDQYAGKEDPDRRVLRGVGPMLEDLDSAVGLLLRSLKELGIDDNTYVFLSSDNGGERGWIGLPPGSENLPDRNAPLRDYKASLYEGGIRVPLIVQGPGVLPGSVCREPVALYDLLPTFYELAGGTDPLPNDIDGGSLCPLLENPGGRVVSRGTPGLIFHRPRWRRLSHSVLRTGDYKLVLTWSGPWQIKDRELFNLAEDIGETRNLRNEMPEKVEQMTHILLTYLKDVNAEVAE